MHKPSKKHYAHTAPHAAEESAPVSHLLTEMFWTISPAFTRWAESHMHQEGMTPQRLRLLALLLKKHPMTMGALSDELGVTATNVTALIDALEEDHMVVRKAHPTDRRSTFIELTPKAEKQMMENCTAFKDRVGEVFSVFNKTEQEQFLSLLLRLREGFVARHVLEASDFCSKLGKRKA